MDCILCGGLWLPARVMSCGLSDNSDCPRCGQPGCDEQHLIWDCPDIVLVDDVAVTNSQYLCAQVDRDLPCLWLRGLLSSSLVAVPPPPDEVELFQVGVAPVWGSLPSGW